MIVYNERTETYIVTIGNKVILTKSFLEAFDYFLEALRQARF